MKAVNLEKLLPSDIPPGERILWHGRPRWISLARRAYRADFVTAYFVALMVWNASSEASAGWLAAALAAAKTAGLGAAALAILAGLALLSARAALDVVTSRRLVLKVGVALPVFINIPFNDIESAAARVFADGTGDIPVALKKGRRIGYFLLWPHARPLRLLSPQPCLRGVADAAIIADTLSRALREAAGQSLAAVPTVREKKAEPRAEARTLAGRAAA